MIHGLKKDFFRFLRSTEKYTKTDMVYLAHGSFWLGIKTLAGIFFTFTLSVAFANLLPQTVYGEYRYVFSLFSFFSIFTLLGMGTAVTKSIAQGYDGTTLAALKTKMLWGILGSIASFAFSLYYFFYNNTILGGAFLLTAVFLPFVDTLSIFNSSLTGKKLFRASTIIEIVIQAFATSTVLILLFFTDNLVTILLGYFSAYTGARLVAFKFVENNYKENNNVDTNTLRYGRHLSVMEVLGTIANTLETILLWQLLGAVPLAIYAFAKAIPVQISAALQRLTTLAFPKFAQRSFVSIQRTLAGKMLQLLILMIIIVVAYIVLAPFIFETFFPHYMDSIIYTQMYALILLFFPQKLIGTAFQAHAHTKKLYITTTVVPIVKIILLLILIPLYGIIGAILSEMGARVINLILMLILLFQTQKVSK